MPRECPHRRWSTVPVVGVSAVTLFAALLLFAAVSKYCFWPRFNEKALFLSPMIRGGRVAEARAACKVNLNNNTAAADSCAGYLTVDEAHDSNLFFWFFPAASGEPDAPVVMWLQGGPGASSLYSVFNEHGPFTVNEDGDLLPRRHTWTATHSMLYVDNPVGVGYSFTGDEAGYTTNQTAIAENLYAALVQFFELYPEYRDNYFYVAGESYAGKYVPAVSYAIHQNNAGARVKINLKGLAIGNGLIDPVNQMVYADYLYERGLIDNTNRQIMEKMSDDARELIAAGNYTGAFDAMSTPLSMYTKLTGLQYIYNVLWEYDPIPYRGGHWYEYVQRTSVRAALHVGLQQWSGMDVVFGRMKYDVPLSVAPRLSALLETGQYRVLLYSGQLDAIVPYQGSVNVAKALRWSGAERFRNANSTAWMVPVRDCQKRCNTTESAGYATTYGPLTVLLIRNAGHMVPYDQPMFAHDMIDRFTSGKPFD
ncbi:venom serine carboxypeptidase-like [Rhopalosiphum padi]|uniref:venom serine carboxypeptidase-like n=1 Tax=Rhopalosiphum padi TaxID=40932 RepID=UPI00298E5EF2|nr:venom serine carboxypeptidase-like [Rhopalosiphum padi]